MRHQTSSWWGEHSEKRTPERGGGDVQTPRQRAIHRMVADAVDKAVEKREALGYRAYVTQYVSVMMARYYDALGAESVNQIEVHRERIMQQHVQAVRDHLHPYEASHPGLVDMIVRLFMMLMQFATPHQTVIALETPTGEFRSPPVAAVIRNAQPTSFGTKALRMSEEEEAEAGESLFPISPASLTDGPIRVKPDNRNAAVEPNETFDPTQQPGWPQTTSFPFTVGDLPGPWLATSILSVPSSDYTFDGCLPTQARNVPDTSRLHGPYSSAMKFILPSPLEPDCKLTFSQPGPIEVRMAPNGLNIDARLRTTGSDQLAIGSESDTVILKADHTPELELAIEPVFTETLTLTLGIKMDVFGNDGTVTETRSITYALPVAAGQQVARIDLSPFAPARGGRTEIRVEEVKVNQDLTIDTRTLMEPQQIISLDTRPDGLGLCINILGYISVWEVEQHSAVTRVAKDLAQACGADTLNLNVGTYHFDSPDLLEATLASAADLTDAIIRVLEFASQANVKQAVFDMSSHGLPGRAEKNEMSTPLGGLRDLKGNFTPNDLDRILQRAEELGMTVIFANMTCFALDGGSPSYAEVAARHNNVVFYGGASNPKGDNWLSGLVYALPDPLYPGEFVTEGWREFFASLTGPTSMQDTVQELRRIFASKYATPRIPFIPRPDEIDGLAENFIVARHPRMISGSPNLDPRQSLGNLDIGKTLENTGDTAEVVTLQAGEWFTSTLGTVEDIDSFLVGASAQLTVTADSGALRVRAYGLGLNLLTETTVSPRSTRHLFTPATPQGLVYLEVSPFDPNSIGDAPTTYSLMGENGKPAALYLPLLFNGGGNSNRHPQTVFLPSVQQSALAPSYPPRTETIHLPRVSR